MLPGLIAIGDDGSAIGSTIERFPSPRRYDEILVTYD
jgi:hypothetical protein